VAAYSRRLFTVFAGATGGKRGPGHPLERPIVKAAAQGIGQAPSPV